MPIKKKKQNKKGENLEKNPNPAQEASSGSGEGVSKTTEAPKATMTEKEALLQQHYDKLTGELEHLRKRMDQLRHENEFLQEEAQRMRVDSQEYVSYISKRTQKCQNAIITLSDQNKEELEKIQKQKEELQLQFRIKEKELRQHLLEKENELLHINKEIADLQSVKDLQQEQQSRVKELEREVMTSRGQHVQNLLQIKSTFLQEKAAFEKDSQQQILMLTKQAHEAAMRSMVQKSEQVIVENQQLRQELHHLIRHSRILQEQKRRLEEQHKQLLWEKQYGQSLARIRHQRKTHIPLKQNKETTSQSATGIK
ncbi:coiled-coil domain-containing protein 121 [Rhinatrema bivittatum]|uniref:coiled-coil domain-containing protein 121 n=1 Tax=Rhinatrema bivittatum TaxID=194408 RepID=UPI0011266B1E|nr:coiled-coil domain-containing protein 121 [Rhinatrema bivittatum]XP_029452228.1 coiled-coil domain-containing protein 121 [Rhinatrema bivittatum]